MTSAPTKGSGGLRFAANEPPPHPFSLVVGLQVAILVTVPIIIVTTIVARVADQSDAYLSWAIFAGMVIGGLMTIVQSKRVGPFGAGNLIVMGTSGAAIGVAVLALVTGGPALLGTLVVASALCQFGFAARLALLRRIITPLVSGVLLALISVTVMPMGFAMFTRVPESAHPAAAPAITAVTIVTVVALMLRAPQRLRAWTPILGIGAGCTVAAFFGVLDFARVGEAAWLGVPAIATPGLDLTFDSRFWVLLPGFLFVTFVITVRQVGDAVRMQRISRREPKAVDFRRVQGAVAACGSGTLLSGLAGIPAPWPYAAGIGLAGGIGIAARRVGVYIGAVFIALAFVPKIAALVLSIPAPVLGAYIVVIFGIAFAQGMRVVFRDGPERRNALVAGLAFWIGAGIQFQAIFPGHLATPTGRMLANGLTAGGLTILLLNLFIQYTGPRRHRTEVRLSADRQPDLDRFMVDFAARYKWPARTTERLRAAAEEALLSLLRQEQDEHAPAAEGRRLRVVARNLREGALLEFTAATRAGNLENEMSVLAQSPDPAGERDLSLALLRHHASSVKHHQYHNVDILTVRVNHS
ncbi:MAG: purine/pyrimidine permease [Gemmatimonadota bacterium]|nr:purine/pyrimidine permease [Gemmatimonadota bacterium]MDE2984282.1 purine/pyrimidine permease [Gemmatimonadota bacterium]